MYISLFPSFFVWKAILPPAGWIAASTGAGSDCNTGVISVGCSRVAVGLGVGVGVGELA